MRACMTASSRVLTQTPRTDVPASARTRLEAFLNARWYGRAGILHLLQPFAWLYAGVVNWRRKRAAERSSHNAETNGAGRLPTIVVGNLVAGGTGKTPVVALLVEELKALGAQPGIVTRGYGGLSASWPLSVTEDLDPALCGDEALELAQSTGCPVVAGPDRSACVARLATRPDCDVVVSDDGLQHYAMIRDLEIVLVDADRQFGNGYPLPVGPLREPIERIREAQLLLVTARSVPAAESAHPEIVRRIGMRAQSGLNCALVPSTAQPLLGGDAMAVGEAPFVGEHCVALSGVGTPERFHSDLQSLGCSIDAQVLADHEGSGELISAGILSRWAEQNWVVTTGKDAVKLRFALSASKADLSTGDYQRVWVLRRRVAFSEAHLSELRRVLDQFSRHWQIGKPQGNS